MELYVIIIVALILLAILVYFILRQKALKGKKWQSIRLREFKAIKKLTADGEHNFDKHFSFPYKANKKDLEKFCKDFRKWLKSEEFFCEFKYHIMDTPNGIEMQLRYKGKQHLRTLVIVNNDDLTVNVIFNF